MSVKNRKGAQSTNTALRQRMTLNNVTSPIVTSNGFPSEGRGVLIRRSRITAVWSATSKAGSDQMYQTAAGGSTGLMSFTRTKSATTAIAIEEITARLKNARR